MKKQVNLRKARRARGWTQAQAAAKLGLSQPYWSLLEKGKRPLTPALARRLVRVFQFPPTVLPLPVRLEEASPVTNDMLAEDLAKLGYPAFAYMQSGKRPRRNPALVLLQALNMADLDPRVTEGLPWLLLHHPGMDTGWLVDQARRHNLQNRLGFVTTLARRVAEGHAPLQNRVEPLEGLEGVIRASQLAKEDTLGRSDLTEGERRWLLRFRPGEAEAWNVLANWTPGDLQYATYAQLY